MKLVKSEKGFTLLEVIITIVIAAILGSLLVTFMGTAVTRSSDPVKQTRDLGASSGSIETISAAYSSYLSNAMSWNDFKTAVGSYTTVPSGSGLYSSSFETIQVTVTTGNQKLISYFMQ